MNCPLPIIDIYLTYQGRVVKSVRPSFRFDDKDMWDFIESHYHVVDESYDSFFYRYPGMIAPGKDLSQKVFNAAWDKVDMTKTPGSPLIHITPNNSGLPPYKPQIYSIVQKRLKQYEVLGKEVWDGNFTPLSWEDHVQVSKLLVQGGHADPELVGIKSEPRDRNKNPRCICQTSVVVNIAARLVLGNHLISEQEQDDLPTCTKLDLTTKEKTRALYNKLKQHELTFSDVQGFEYSVNERDRWRNAMKVAYCSGCLTRHGPVPGKERHLMAILGFTFVAIHRVVQLPTGQLLVVPPGQISSGGLDTYSANSFIRADLSNDVSLVLTGKPVLFVATAGDDAGDTNPPTDEATEVYLSFGKVVTGVAHQAEYYSFCSTTFTSETSWQENIQKSTYAALLRGYLDAGASTSFDLSFSAHPLYKFYRAWVDQLPVAAPVGGGE